MGVLLMLACAGAAYWMLTDDSFDLGAARIAGDLRYTDAQSLLVAAGVGPNEHPNVVGLRTEDMAQAIASLPAIADVTVTTALPNTVSVSVDERIPVFALNQAGSTYLVDEDGLVLAASDAAHVAALGLPTVDDQRTQSMSDLKAGSSIDPIDLAAILQLGAITPALIDSSAASLALSVSDQDGFVINALPTGWQAIFGQYTPNLRPTNIIPRQVQCLRSLLGATEADVHTVYLAPLDDRCGTYLPTATPRATPRATSTPSGAR